MHNLDNASKVDTYQAINPSLNTHSVYKNSNIPEYARISFSRLRLIAHSLKIETGRWTGMARENRLCSCQVTIQSEEHVLLHCMLTCNLRTDMNLKYNNISELMNHPNQTQLVIYIHKSLILFK